MAGTAAYVVDSSALLAFSQGEEGAALVGPLLERSAICSVNWAEVLQRALSMGLEAQGKQEDLESLGVQIVPFIAEDASYTANLWSSTRRAGLSLGDRACLSLAHRLGLPALTADRAWSSLGLDVEVRLIR
ncbi:MAG: twitching motility protein PilT [SAR202 cluster bacterium Io17-Chloro-G4]|nr:MAG: twitching motility protein PilT [SAR202 cluster bacterium Io17-Chloro-G4]